MLNWKQFSAKRDVFCAFILIKTIKMRSQPYEHKTTIYFFSFSARENVSVFVKNGAPACANLSDH